MWLQFWFKSRLKRSILWLCTELPVKTEPSTLLECMSSQIWTFSPLWSFLMCGGLPNCQTAAVKTSLTVSARLLLEQWRKINILLSPSMAPWTTNFHLINLWFPSTCHMKFGCGTEYTRRAIADLLLARTPIGSILRSESLTHCLWTTKFLERRCHISITSPTFGCSVFICDTSRSNCWSLMLLNFDVGIL